MDDFIKSQIKSILTVELRQTQTKGTIINDYMYEASFIPYFTNQLLKPQIRAVARDALTDVLVGETVEDYVDKQVVLIGRDAIIEAFNEESERENIQSFKIDIKRNLVDNLLFTSMNEMYLGLYQQEEETELIEQKEKELKQFKEIQKKIKKLGEDDDEYKTALNERLKQEKARFNYNYANQESLNYDAMAGVQIIRNPITTNARG